jgi:hypothetical protein
MANRRARIGTKAATAVVVPLMLLLSSVGLAQGWSAFLDSSRATDWTGVGFAIPNYTASCATQPTLKANDSSAAASNATAIQNALGSCDATHNVVNIPAGTYYVTGIVYPPQGHQVLRGAGPILTKLIPTAGNSCAGGTTDGVCMIAADTTYNGSTSVMPGGTQQCSWTAGYAKGATTITLSNCGGAPPVNHSVILTQANDTSENGGVFICDGNTAGCSYETTTGGNNDGQFINGVDYSEQQVAYVTGATSLGGGSYSVTISPGVYFTNVRSSQTPRAWWPGMVQNDGLEDLSIDGATMSSGAPTNFGNIGMYSCYQCWVKNVRSLNAGRHHIEAYQSDQDVIRDSYIFGSLGSHSQSYAVEFEEASGLLVENNIFQQVTTPIMFGAGTGNVIGYNFSINSNYLDPYVQQAYTSHNAGNNFNLFEGNDFLGIAADDAWGTSTQNTYFRNMLYGWQSGKSENLIPIVSRSNNRVYNVVGNVLGQPGYHTGYETYATSTSTIVGGPESVGIYSLGLAGQDTCTENSVVCDPLVRSTLMRWGNYDTVHDAVRWDATEASPAAVPYVSANFTASHFSSLAHTLPASLYQSSKPAWWGNGPWPSTGPDVSSGNVGVCSGGTYAGGQATSASQCGGGTLTTGWGSHASAIPALNCYLNVMAGPPDGSGSALSFDASLCYTTSTTGGAAPAAPTGLTAVVS